MTIAYGNTISHILEMSAIFFMVWVEQVEKFYQVCTNITSAIVCKRITCSWLITVALAVNPHPTSTPPRQLRV